MNIVDYNHNVDYNSTLLYEVTRCVFICFFVILISVFISGFKCGLRVTYTILLSRLHTLMLNLKIFLKCVCF